MDTGKILEYYTDTEHFKLTNPNPIWKTKRGYAWNIADCAIRALANSAGCDWMTAYDYLSSKARRDYSVPNDGDSMKKWLAEDGGIWTPFKIQKGKPRMTVLEFCKKYREGTYIIYLSGHCAAVKDGVLLDVFNFTRNIPGTCLYGYIDMKNFLMK